MATLSIRPFWVSFFLTESFTLLRRPVGREKVLYMLIIDDRIDRHGEAASLSVPAMKERTLQQG
jgi:hypothetical protein